MDLRQGRHVFAKGMVVDLPEHSGSEGMKHNLFACNVIEVTLCG